MRMENVEKILSTMNREQLQSFVSIMSRDEFDSIEFSCFAQTLSEEQLSRLHNALKQYIATAKACRLDSPPERRSASTASCVHVEKC